MGRRGQAHDASNGVRPRNGHNEAAARGAFPAVCCALAIILAASIVTARQTAPAGAGSAPALSAREKQLGAKVMCMCGTCNMAAAACNHPGAAFSGPCDVAKGELAEIHERVARGDSDSLILQSFVQEYGPLALIEPPRSGFDWLVWVMPVLAPVLAIAVLWIVIRTWRARRAEEAAEHSRIPPELLARVQQDAAEDFRGR